MRIDLPSPPRGWREFFWELLIVFIGVLVALWAQQLFNDLSSRAEASRAKTDLDEEIGRNFGVLRERQRTQACVDRRLDEIATHLDNLSRGEVRQAPRWIGRPQFWGMIDRRWDVASQSGRVSLLSSEELNAYSRIYAILDYVEDHMDKEEMLWAQLRSLEGQRQLSDQSIFEMRRLLSQARHANWRIKLGMTQAFEESREVGIKPIITRRGSRSVCVPMDTPRAVALTLARAPYGEP